MIDFIKQKYKIRQCRNYQNRTRPCLNYHIKRCLAPCMGYVTPEEYKKQIDEIIDLLEGKTDKILKELDKQMQEASEKLDFAKAAELRAVSYTHLFISLLSFTPKYKKLNIFGMISIGIKSVRDVNAGRIKSEKFVTKSTYPGLKINSSHAPMLSH